MPRASPAPSIEPSRDRRRIAEGCLDALVISASARMSVNIQNEAGLAPTKLKQIEYTTRPGSATRRML
jgi:hypothetical protein